MRYADNTLEAIIEGHGKYGTLIVSEDKLQAYIDTKCREARVEEVDNWFGFYINGGWANTPAISITKIKDRLAELSKDQEGE